MFIAASSWAPERTRYLVAQVSDGRLNVGTLRYRNVPRRYIRLELPRPPAAALSAALPSSALTLAARAAQLLECDGRGICSAPRISSRRSRLREHAWSCATSALSPTTRTCPS